MAIEIVDFPIKNGDVPWQNVSSPEGNPQIFDDKPDLLHILRRYMDLTETPKRSNG